MVTIQQFRKLALQLPEVTEEPHFDKTSFRVRKKIFATFDQKNNMASLKLSPNDQYAFCTAEESIAPVPNKWGAQGWTQVKLGNVPHSLFKQALKAAFLTVAPKSLASSPGL